MNDYGLEELLHKIQGAYPEAYESIRMIAQNRIKQSVQTRDGSLSRQAYEKTLGQVVLELLPPMSETEQAILKEKYPCLYLTQEQEGYLMQVVGKNPDYVSYLGIKNLVGSEDDDKLSQHVAQSIHASLSPEDQGKYTVSAIQFTMKYIPIMNLGVIEFSGGSGSSSFKDFVRHNTSFFDQHQDIAGRMLVQYFMRNGEMFYNGRLDQFLTDVRRELVEMGFKKNE